MLKENQIRAIFQECETALGVALTTLRARLASQNDFEATLWELLVLYGAIPLGKVQYEPSEGTPDILIETPTGMRVWLEATYMYPQDAVQDDDLQAFPQWLRQAIHKAGCPWGQQAHIRLDPARADQAMTILRRNQWTHMCRHPSWQDFVALLTTRQQAVWECPQGKWSRAWSVRRPLGHRGPSRVFRYIPSNISCTVPSSTKRSKRINGGARGVPTPRSF
jgi:hypothetical protein